MVPFLLGMDRRSSYVMLFKFQRRIRLIYGKLVFIILIWSSIRMQFITLKVA